MAVTVHYEFKGVPISMLLDLVEVPKSHSGINLAAAFAQILHDFGISDKVRLNLVQQKQEILTVYVDNKHCVR